MVKCKHCRSEIPKGKYGIKFCSISCSTSYNNKKRRDYSYTKNTKIVQCSECEKDVEIKINGSNPKCEECKEKNYNLKKENGYYKKYHRKPPCGRCGIQFFEKYKQYCDICRKEYYEIYRPSCRFEFDPEDYSEYFNEGLKLIRLHGKYSPKNKGNNLNGVSMDHIVSVKFGFINNIDPEIIKHPANCRLILHSQNNSKHDKCDMTLDELLDKIKKFPYPAGGLQNH